MDHEKLRLAVVSDSVTDADTLVRVLSEAGYSPEARRVATLQELADLIAAGATDIAFVYGAGAGMDPVVAVRRFREADLDIPIIYVSTGVGLDPAVRVLIAGAHDVLPADGLSSAASLVEQQLKSARDRAEAGRVARAVQTVANEWRTAVDTVRSPICLVGPTGSITRCNRAFQRLAGVPFLEIVGRDIGEVLTRMEGKEDGQGAAGHAAAPSQGLRAARVKGLTFEVQVEPVLYASGVQSGYVYVMNDVTERLRAEAEARKSEMHLAEMQKMEAVGQLAGGIAHDFNNILTGIMGYCSILLLRLPPDSPLRTFISSITSAAKRAASLTQGLLTFARRQPLKMRPADLNALVSAGREFMSRVIGAAIEIRLDLCPEALPVLVDSVQIEQLLLNLSTNARDAMPQGGEITVRTKRDAPDLPQPFGYLYFSDTGVGMDEETIKRVFEPFFTTKEVGKGTGLGLSVVWSIAEQNGGRISVDSTVGRGTTFTIALPLIKTTSNASEAQTAGLAVGGSETILVVEDDDIVRDTARATLEGVGYTVIEAADGEAALAAFSSCRDTIALAVVDVVLPKGNGAQLLEDMRKTKPQMKALVMSAHDDRLHDAGAGGAATGLLRKPFMPLDLVARVREVLDG